MALGESKLLEPHRPFASLSSVLAATLSRSKKAFLLVELGEVQRAMHCETAIERRELSV